MSLWVSIRKRLSESFALAAEFTAGDGLLGILGASGCGKSMTLKCVAGIETPDEGRIVLNGRVLFDSARGVNLKPQARRVGYLFQNYALFPRMTVAENISAALLGSRPAKAEKTAAWIRRFHLEGLERRYPHELSGGQQQRAALARMLVREPEAVLLDEPFSALDSHLREQMQMETLEMVRGREDVILVTHDRSEAYKLCASLMVMDDGRILKQGDTSGMFRQPEWVRVARLTGCKNISPVRRVGGREVFALDWGVTLTAGAPVDASVTHIGVRAHDFLPAAGPSASNCIRIRVCGQSDGPFERTVLFAPEGAPPEAGGTAALWWQYDRRSVGAMPDYLCVPPEAILLLREH
jgi:molybdate transport system ATP-binding protein